MPVSAWRWGMRQARCLSYFILGVAAARADPALFAYRQESFASAVTPRAEHARYREFAVSYPSPMTTEFPANNTVHGQLYLPRSATATQRVPGVIVLHILGGPDGPSQLLAAHLARDGFAALHLVMPLYGPRGDGKHRFISTDVDLTVQLVRQAVMDIRRGADWLAARPDVAPDQIGITGISLGGHLACLAFSVDPRFRAAALGLTGGDLAKILTAGELSARRRGEMEAQGLTYETLRGKLAAIDPLTHARGLHRRDDILMFNARGDEVVLPECADQLWEALDKPRRYWLHAGHYTAIIYLPDVADLTGEFFRRRFSP